MTQEKEYLTELYIRATEKMGQMSQIAQHINNLLEDKRYKEIEPWGLIWDDLEAEVESIILIREALL